MRALNAKDVAITTDLVKTWSFRLQRTRPDANLKTGYQTGQDWRRAQKKQGAWRRPACSPGGAKPSILTLVATARRGESEKTQTKERKGGGLRVVE